MDIIGTQNISKQQILDLENLWEESYNLDEEIE